MRVPANKDKVQCSTDTPVMGRTKKGTVSKKQPVRFTRLKAASKAPNLTTRVPPRGQPKPRKSNAPSNSGGLPASDPPRRMRSNTQNTSTSSATTSSTSSSSAALTQDDIPHIVNAVLNSLPNHQAASGTLAGEEQVEEMTEALEDSSVALGDSPPG